MQTCQLRSSEPPLQGTGPPPCVRRRAPHQDPTVARCGRQPLALQVSTGQWSRAGCSQDATPRSGPARRVLGSCRHRPRPFSSSCGTGYGLGGWLCRSRAVALQVGAAGCGLRAREPTSTIHIQSRGEGRSSALQRDAIKFPLMRGCRRRVWAIHRPFGKLSTVIDFSILSAENRIFF